MRSIRVALVTAALALAASAAAQDAPATAEDLEDRRCVLGIESGCVGLRSGLSVVPERGVSMTFNPYFPQDLLPELYRRLALPEEAFSCVAIGDGRELSGPRVLAGSFVSFEEAVRSGLAGAEFEAFLADERNYAPWRVAVLRERNERDPFGWLPERNRCWYVARYLSIKAEWTLSADWQEIDAIQDVLDTCAWSAIFSPTCGDEVLLGATVPAGGEPASFDETRLWTGACDADGDGRVSCLEVERCAARRPVIFGDPLYPLVIDIDRDGVACR